MVDMRAVAVRFADAARAARRRVAFFARGAAFRKRALEASTIAAALTRGESLEGARLPVRCITEHDVRRRTTFVVSSRTNSHCNGCTISMAFEVSPCLPPNWIT